MTFMAYNKELWLEAKRRCKFNDEEIQMAKEMGLNPKSLIKSIPNKNEQWKLPVKIWIRDMYEDRFGKTRGISDYNRIKSKKKIEELPYKIIQSVIIIFVLWKNFEMEHFSFNLGSFLCLNDF